MKALITGGAGFIGSHLSETLVKRGWDVVVIDNLSTGTEENIKHLKRYKRFQFHCDSIFNHKLMRKLVNECDVVFHLAAAVGVRLIIEQPVKTIHTNIHGTEIVLRMANNMRKRVIIASSSEVYGKGESIPFSEDADLVFGSTSKSRWSYACSKAIDEFLALAYFREHALPVTIVRLFNTIGPRQTGRYGMVLPTFIRQAADGEPITVFGDGKQTRVFTHVSDVVDSLEKLVDRSPAFGEVFNIGGKREISIAGLAKKVKKLLNSKSKIAFIPYDDAYEQGFEDLRHRVPDTAKIRKLTGFRPKVGLDEAIMEIANNIRLSGRKGGKK